MTRPAHHLRHVALAAAAAALLIPPPPASALSIFGQSSPAQAPAAVPDHDPAKLKAQGIVPWDMLRELDISYESLGPGKTVFTTSFSAELKALDGKEVKLIGFVYPTEPGETHARFLLAAYPPSCPFCLPGGPTDMVDVQAKEAVRFSNDAVTLAGRFELLQDDPSGLYYRLHDAREVK